MHRSIRFLLIGVIAAGLAPSIWLRDPSRAPDFDAPVGISQIADPQSLTPGLGGNVKLLGLWHLTSRNAHFGGFSALVTLGKDRLLAGSDRARLLDFPLPQTGDMASARMRFFPSRKNDARRVTMDMEALERDAASDTLWATFEHSHAIERVQTNRRRAITAPNAMQHWHANGGAETLIRLKDDRFIVIGEKATTHNADWRPALLFARDPVADCEPLSFHFAAPADFSPVDGTVLADGRVIVLVRRVVWGLPPRFASALVLADPQAIAQDRPWQGRVIASLEGAHLDENFEGIAAVEQDDGSVDLYLISDDNQSAFQRTLLVQLNWMPDR